MKTENELKWQMLSPGVPKYFQKYCTNVYSEILVQDEKKMKVKIRNLFQYNVFQFDSGFEL